MSQKRKAVYNREADRRWRAKNKERVKYINLRSSARSFIRNHATAEDLKEIEALIENRRKSIKS